jgi:hypothetical protein
MNRTRGLCTIVLLLIAAPAANADYIAAWDFNDSNLAVDEGLGTLATNFSSVSYVAGTTTNARPSVAAGSALNLQSNANNGRYVLISFSTTSFEDVMVSLAWRRNNMGFNSNQIAYSLDGTNFTSFQSNLTPPTTNFGVQTLDFSALNTLEDQSTVYVGSRSMGRTTTAATTSWTT